MPLNNITSVNNVMKNKEMAKDINRESVHMGLMAAGLTPGYGIFADAADAALYLMEGEFGESALSGLSAIPFIGQYATSLRTLDKAKKAKEPTVKLYKGISDKRYDNTLIKDNTRMKNSVGLDKKVPEGNYVGGGDLEQIRKGDYTGSLGGYADTPGRRHQAELFGTKGPTRELPSQALYTSTDPKVAEMYARKGQRGAKIPGDMASREPIILEFEVPVSWLKKHRKKILSADKNLFDTYNIGGPGSNSYEAMTIFDEGLPKGFLSKVNKYSIKEIPVSRGQQLFDLKPLNESAKKGLTSTWDDIAREAEGHDKLIKEIFKVMQ